MWCRGHMLVVVGLLQILGTGSWSDNPGKQCHHKTDMGKAWPSNQVFSQCQCSIQWRGEWKSRGLSLYPKGSRGASQGDELLVEGLSLMDGSGTLVASMYQETLWKSLVVKPCHTPKEVCNVGRVHGHQGNHDLWVKWYKLCRVSNYHDSLAHVKSGLESSQDQLGMGWYGWKGGKD